MLLHGMAAPGPILTSRQHERDAASELMSCCPTHCELGLWCVQQVARHTHSLRPRFRDLVDLLLGWSLDPQLPDAMRSASCLVLPICCHKYSSAVRLHDRVQSADQGGGNWKCLTQEKVLFAC